MRLQSINLNFLTSALLFSLVYAVYVPHPTDHLSSTKNVVADATVRGGDNSAMDQTIIDYNSGSTISKRSKTWMPLFKRGALCDKTFYPKELIEKVAMDACTKLYKTNPSNFRQKMMSCAPNVPHCNYNFPHLYKGPKEFFNFREPLYVWPIVTNRLRKVIGLKLLHCLCVHQNFHF